MRVALPRPRELAITGDAGGGAKVSPSTHQASQDHGSEARLLGDLLLARQKDRDQQYEKRGFWLGAEGPRSS
jgi:hypothetical protein